MRIYYPTGCRAGSLQSVVLPPRGMRFRQPKLHAPQQMEGAAISHNTRAIWGTTRHDPSGPANEPSGAAGPLWGPEAAATKSDRKPRRLSRSVQMEAGPAVKHQEARREEQERKFEAALRKAHRHLPLVAVLQGRKGQPEPSSDSPSKASPGITSYIRKPTATTSTEK